MAIGDVLLFTGRRWPAARLTQGDGSVDELAFTATGDGQSWSTSRPLMFWRNFAALANAPADKILKFIARHGDPDGLLDEASSPTERISTTAGWGAVQDGLACIANAWDERDSDLVYRLGKDRQRLDEAEDALRSLADPYRRSGRRGLADVDFVAHGRALVPEARSLRAFMVASAASALRHSTPMRICAHCHDFFELRRTDAFFCSGTCQAAESRKRLEAEVRGRAAATTGMTIKESVQRLKSETGTTIKESLERLKQEAGTTITTNLKDIIDGEHSQANQRPTHDLARGVQRTRRGRKAAKKK